ncbi:hypothetical protein M3Y99_00410400 [Aphelenchoides fujianensis]|nr:hypothetical protein M3Y99_00410400 [Aphelenchoides fujianensis]
MAELVTWFTSRLAILKLLQLLCSFITIIFLVDGKIQWTFYSIVFIIAIILSIITFLTLVFYFLRLHVQQNNSSLGPNSRYLQELAFNAIAAATSLVFSAVLIYDLARMWGGDFSHHRYGPPANIREDGWRNRILIILFAQLLNTAFYFASFYRTKTNGLK